MAKRAKRFKKNRSPKYNPKIHWAHGPCTKRESLAIAKLLRSHGLTVGIRYGEAGREVYAPMDEAMASHQVMAAHGDTWAARILELMRQGKIELPPQKELEGANM